VEREFWTGDGQERGTSVIQVRSKLFPGQKYIAFVPLPVFDVESEKITYTVIGLKRKLKPQRASYISMMLFSMYIYFKAQHERGEHQRMYFSMLSLMISVIDAKDPVTAGHSQRVASIAKDIGIWLNLSKGEQFDLEFTALLHDIGKIGVSDYVLNKQSVYTQNDFEQMKYHTIRGAEMLSEVGISEEIIDGVRHHHERIDGKGYPDGLKGDQLSLFAKIIKIADVFDALTSKRQYKDAWEIECQCVY
jgi:putative nucleotidyltransferase with HDIG domain